MGSNTLSDTKVFPLGNPIIPDEAPEALYIGPGPQKATIPASGDYRIDALRGGYKWGITTIPYSFYSGGSYYGSEAGLAPLSATAQNNVRNILENFIEPLINVNFVEVADSSASYGQLRYLLSTSPGYAYAYYPYSTDTNQGNANDRAGDVFFNSGYDYAGETNGIQNGPGSHGYQTIIHETLHAIGLKHPGNYNGSGAGDPPYLPYGEDNWDNTLMTYNFQSGAEPSTPMAYDVLALQYLYGAKSFNSANTVYTFTRTDLYNDGSRTVGSSTLFNKVTIWDSAGTDTLNFASVASSSSGYRFDMNAGGWLTSQSAFNGSTYSVNPGPPVSYIAGTTYSATTFGTRLAYGVTIENLVNSPSNDYIIANSTGNVFSGYGATTTTGNDTIEGANNLDTLDLSAFASASVTQTQTGNNLVLGLGSGRSATVKDYFVAPVANRINIQYASGGITLAIASTDANKNEGNSGSTPSTPFTFTVTRSGSTTGTTAVNYAVTGSGATPADATDFGGVLPSGIVNFGIGQTSQVITVNVNGDTVVEPNDGFTVTLSSPSSPATITTATALGTIINDDSTTGGISLTGDDEDNYLLGGSGNDTLQGLGGNDILNGASGADSLLGGLGNDIYYVDNTGDLVSEASGAGTDSVNTSITYTLPLNVENLLMIDTGNPGDNINGTGNTLNNKLTGNSGANTLTGDTGNDTLNGGKGSDNLNGGAGNDTYIVDTPNDVITDSAGTDTVKSSINWTLATGLENLTLTGSTAINGTGNSVNNIIIGNTGANILTGLDGNDSLTGDVGNDTLLGGNGNDTLIGSAGNDSLTGGAGSDFFQFNAKTEGIDTISDFAVVDDTIRVSRSGFGGGLVAGTLLTAQFTLGASATNSAHRFGYESGTGKLWFDADGSVATIAPVQIATLSTGLGLTNADIVVF